MKRTRAYHDVARPLVRSDGYIVHREWSHPETSERACAFVRFRLPVKTYLLPPSTGHDIPVTVPSKNSTQLSKPQLLSNTADVKSDPRAAMNDIGMAEVGRFAGACKEWWRPSRYISASCGDNFPKRPSRLLHLSGMVRRQITTQVVRSGFTEYPFIFVLFL